MSVFDKIKAAKEPGHVGATCPNCDEDMGTPFDVAGHGTKGDAREMLCIICGAEWRTDDAEEIAAAWYGWASYQAAELPAPSDSELRERKRLKAQADLYAENMAAKAKAAA